MRERTAATDYDEVRVISLPPPMTAAVNRLLREEQGWHLLDVRVTERLGGGALDSGGVLVVYVLGHEASRAENSTTAESGEPN